MVSLETVTCVLMYKGKCEEIIAADVHLTNIKKKKRIIKEICLTASRVLMT
jgi:hypothetical protein